MTGNKHDNGVHEVGTDEIVKSYQEDTPYAKVEKYIKERNDKKVSEKKKHFSQVFQNPLKGFPYNEEFEVSLKEDTELSEMTQEVELDEDFMSFLAVALPAFIGVNTVAFVGLIASEMAGIDIIGKFEKAIENIKSKFKRNKNYKPSKSELETLKKVGQEVKKKDPSAYKKAQQKVNSMKESFEPLEENADASLKKKSEKTGIPFGILKKVYNRGVAAWKTGHRPGTTPEQWGHARVNSFATKSKGTWGGADKDLAKQVD